MGGKALVEVPCVESVLHEMFLFSLINCYQWSSSETNNYGKFQKRKKVKFKVLNTNFWYCLSLHSVLIIGPSISKDSNCTSYCANKNLTCSTEFTEISIESLNCNRPSNTSLHIWHKEYHPSYNQDSQLCEGFKQTNAQCDKVNTSSSNILRICFCLRPGRSLHFTNFILWILIYET